MIKLNRILPSARLQSGGRAEDITETASIPFEMNAVVPCCHMPVRLS